jgi:hypothetical protein
MSEEKDERKAEEFVTRNPEQRRWFHKIMEIVKHLEIPTKLAVIKNIVKSIRDDWKGEDKHDN